ncbi:MAG: hypothetical protein LQ344_000981 [Seirophora lacunosa]|nr:MAG: hypothetical protein LQ344_000981 [Seirophora lacunosa]
MAKRALDVPAFATAQLSLLAAELAAETSQNALLLSTHSPRTLSRAGLAITNLSLSSQRTGLGGKTVLELEQDSAVGGEELGDHGIRVGDIVKVEQQPKGGERKLEKRSMEGKGLEGVVVRIGRKAVQVALDKEEDEGDGLGGMLWVVKLANDVTYKRMNWTMEKIKRMEEREYPILMRVLFGLDSPTPVARDLNNLSEELSALEFFDPTLNKSQRDAVKFALASNDVALIHGPPGTGKTYTLIELIRQLVKRSRRILVCGPSNISVDNIVERLAPHKIPIVRLGHPARLLPSVLDHSLDVLTQTSEAAAIVKDVRKEMDDKQASIKKTRNGKERRAIYGDIKELRKEYREREKQCVTTLVQGSKVVLATLHGAGGFQLRHEQFDVVIIDEGSQALEAQCWIPLLSAKKLVLAGDHLQLPPTIKSTSPSHQLSTLKKKPDSSPSASLEITLFDRLLHLHGPSIKRMLTTQYRMHASIMSFPSAAIYDSQLLAAESVASRLLTGLAYRVDDTDDTREPLIFYDTQGGDFPELDITRSDEAPESKSALLLQDSTSKSNPSEVLVVARHVAALLDAGVRGEDIAVITPYNAQVGLLRAALKDKEGCGAVEVGSVDGFQGREKEAVVVSLVRSNGDGEVGFLGEKRRLNMAMTRPKRQLCVVGDSETVAK